MPSLDLTPAAVRTPPVAMTFISRLTVGDVVQLTPDGPWLTVQWISHECCWSRVTWRGESESRRIHRDTPVAWQERS